MAAEALIRKADDRALTDAARALAHGGVVAFPTDTVYGLACELFNEKAVHQIYRIKGRPAHLPLIAMLASIEQWSQVGASLPDVALRYMERYWPGPLTIIIPAREDIPKSVLGEGTSIGLRIPDLFAARRLLFLAGKPLATTSANRSGQPAACTAEEVAHQLATSVDLILDGGPCMGAVPSTVVDCTVDPPRILREGPITAAMLAEIGPAPVKEG